MLTPPWKDCASETDAEWNPCGRAVAMIGAAATLPGAGSTNGFRYQTIAARNPFSLREPAPTPRVEPLAQPASPPPQVVITGLTDLGGIRKALMEITDMGKPVVRTILAEGEAQGAICVLRIDLPVNRVKIRIRDAESFLELRTPNSPASPAPPVRTPLKPPLPG